MRILRVFVLILALPSLLSAQPYVYGAIDIGSKGVKAFLFSLTREEEGASVIFSKSINTKLASSMVGSRFTVEGINEVADASGTLLREMREKVTEAKISNVTYS